MGKRYRVRRIVIVAASLLSLVLVIMTTPDLWQPAAVSGPVPRPSVSAPLAPIGDAASVLASLPIKGRAAKTGYARTQFGDGWEMSSGCSTREIILHRDLTNVSMNQKCQVVSGVLQDPYTGKTINFARGATSSQDVQIDHVVALSNAWQTGAQQLTPERRAALANDPLELLAVDGPANQAKSDGDAATWLPPNKSFRCQYVARQIAVKQKYDLWVTQAEHDAIQMVLAQCPGQALPIAGV